MDEKISFNFQNLIVEAQPEYLINNPGEGNHNTTITFQLSSAQKKYCTATISIYSSTGQLVKQETLNNLICPGSYTYQWGGKGNQMPLYNKVLAGGIYPYDIYIQGASPYDTDTRCSPYLKVAQTKFELAGGTNDPSQVDDGSSIPPIKPKISYVLEDTLGNNAYSAKISVFDKYTTLVHEEQSDGVITNLPGTTTPIWNERILNLDVGEIWQNRPFVFLVSAIDNHRDSEKAHRRKPSLQKNTVSSVKVYRVVIDIGHYYNYSKYPEGTLGTKYCNSSVGSEPEKLIDRYPWYEYCANYCLGQSLYTCLALHNQRCIHHWFIPDICEPTDRELKLTGGKNYEERLRLRAEHISKYVKEGDRCKIPAKIFVSIHHDGIAYPFHPNTANFAAYAVQQSVPEKGRYDKDLADSLVACLRALPEVELPPDNKQKGDCFGEIRSASLKYRPNYGNSEEHHYAVLRALSPPTSDSLLETLTLTNYDEEDYSIYCAVGNIAKEIRGAFNLFVFMHPEELP